MLTILHGENISQSRQKLVELLNQAKAKNTPITQLEAKRLDLPLLESTLGNTSLFADQQLVVIEELHSLPISKKRDALIKMVASFSQNSPALEIILWEKRTLTATMLKTFGNATVFEFKLSNSLFKWLDSLTGQPPKDQPLKLFHETLTTEDEYTCFVMLIRHIRLLIQAKDGGQLKGAPFMIAKIKKQSSNFTLPQLMQAYHRLLEIDMSQKTSTNRLSMTQDLDLLLLTM